ncbi:MAG: damage-control phosphatase ARMT1 family protein [Planctomycetota bacterium]
MKALPDCIPCMFKQALNTVRATTDDPAVEQAVLQRLAGVVETLKMDDTPAGVSQNVYRVIAEVTGETDPYREQKAASNREALQVLPELEALVKDADDPLLAAIHLAAVGNIIDMGIGAGHDFDIQRDVRPMLETPLAVEHVADFRADLAKARQVLFLCDNAGEIVFDRVFIEQIRACGPSVTASVKSGPVINDALMEDAETAGLPAVATVIETGSDDIGVNWSRCSDQFRAAYDAADVVVSKGQGNFETVSGQPGNVYFLLKAKCECVARALGVQFGDIVFEHSRG